MEKLEIRLLTTVDKLGRLRDFLIKHESSIEGAYLESNKWKIENDKTLNLKNELKEIREQTLNAIDNDIKFAEKIIKLDFISQSENKLKSPLFTLINEFLDSFEYINDHIFNEHIFGHIGYIAEQGINYESIFILGNFVDTSKNIILIGANGSGKSSLANTLKGRDQDVISVIPAQKSLHFSIHDKSVLTSNINELVYAMLENNILKSKEIENGYFDYQYNQFTRLIVALKNDYFRYLVKAEQDGRDFDGNHIFAKLKKIFKTIFPDIDLRFDTDDDNFLTCEKDGNHYNINGLSEGEKATLYYSISVLAAKENSFIIVDEPETYLNPSLANTLWDLLIESREDCQFIFITHSVDFVLSRENSKIMWLEKFTNAGDYIIKEIDDNHHLPKKLITEILGSKKSIIFCEGDDKTSLDSRVYRSIFGNDYTVIPVGGHRTVVEYTNSINNNEMLNLEAFGIIDRDFLSDEQVSKYRNNNIVVLDFHEVEMFLLCDEILTSYMNKVFYENSVKMIDDFKFEFWKIFKNKINHQSLIKLKCIIDNRLENQKIERFDSLESIEESIEKISKLDIQKEFAEIEERLQLVWTTKDYGELLKYCSLKREISKGLTSRMLDADYIDKSIVHLKNEVKLREELKIKYFSSLYCLV